MKVVLLALLFVDQRAQNARQAFEQVLNRHSDYESTLRHSTGRIEIESYEKHLANLDYEFSLAGSFFVLDVKNLRNVPVPYFRSVKGANSKYSFQAVQEPKKDSLATFEVDLNRSLVRKYDRNLRRSVLAPVMLREWPLTFWMTQQEF